jgi:predicted adenine nucleotide alpha hydrolase (AANH) superfamily ATPase
MLNAGIELSGWFYNPNIHPFTEYKKRLEGVVFLNDRLGVPLTAEGYGLRYFLDMVARARERCIGCYTMRINRTAEYAAKSGFDAFSTTLLYSRRQRHDDIKLIAEEAAAAYNVTFYYEDFRKGWQVGIDISKQLGVYRQQYCGCIFSEEERYNTLNTSGA